MCMFHAQLFNVPTLPITFLGYTYVRCSAIVKSMRGLADTVGKYS